MITGKIVGLGSYLPPKIMTNDDLAQIVETNDEWITERTGIKRRHVADGIEDKSSTMACKAAVKGNQKLSYEEANDSTGPIQRNHFQPIEQNKFRMR